MTSPVILVSNDDGIEAPGLKALVRALEKIFDVWVVAPEGERSTSSHALSLRHPVAVTQVGDQRFAVDGWPADCVYLGLFELLPTKPDLVISGINLGANLGTDVLYSGTVAAASEAFSRGHRAIAVSLVKGDDFDLAAQYTAQLARAVVSEPNSQMLLNINVPGSTAKGVRVAGLGKRIYPECASKCGVRGEATLYKLASCGGVSDALLPGSDGEAIEEGYISVTPVQMGSTVVRDLEATRSLCEPAWKSSE